MGWFIIGLIAWIIYFVHNLIQYISCKKENVSKYSDSFISKCDLIATTVVSLFITAGLAMILTFVTSCFIPEKYVAYEKTNEWNIIALQDNLTSHSRMYIRSAYVDTDLSYFYAYQSSKGIGNGYIPANRSYINYTNGTPHIEKYSGKWSKETISWFTFPLDMFSGVNATYYKVFVPEGTIEENFNVDLK